MNVHKQVWMQRLALCIIRICTHFFNYLWHYFSKESRHTNASTYTTACITYLLEKYAKTGGPSSHAVTF
jgi:hypothetical protein